MKTLYRNINGLILLLLLAAILSSQGCGQPTGNNTNSSGGYHPMISYTSDGGVTWDADIIMKPEFGSATYTKFDDFIVIGGGVYDVLYGGIMYYSDDDWHNWNISGVQHKFYKFSSGLGKGYAMGNVNIDGSGDSSVISVSTDGLSWSDLYKQKDIFVDMDSYLGNIIIAGFDKIYYTTNSGSSWNQGIINASGLNKVEFVSGNKAVCTCSNRDIYITTDNGATWNPTAEQHHFLDFCFKKETDFGIGSIGNGLLITTDGGVTWNSSLNTNQSLNSVFLNNNVCMAVGGGSYRSYDNGLNWQFSSLPDSVSGQKVFFQDDGLYGYVTGTILTH